MHIRILSSDFYQFIFILPIIFALSFFVSPVFAATYSEDFESVDHPTITTFTTTSNGLSATYVGGTAFTAGVAPLYRSGVKSWMLDRVGVAGSTGEGTITLSEGAKSITLYFRDQSDQTTSTLQVQDEMGNAIQDFNGTTSWQEVTIIRNDGESLIKTIALTNNGTSGMVAVDDVSYTTADDMGGDDTTGKSGDDDDGGGGGGSTGLVLLVLLVARVRQAFSRIG